MRTEDISGAIKIINVFPDEPLPKYKKLQLAENVCLMLETFSNSKMNSIKTTAKAS